MLVPSLILVLVGSCFCYVVRQPTKAENSSNVAYVDAFNAKDTLNMQPGSPRKQWPSYKRFEIRKRADEEEKRAPDASMKLDSLLFAINTGALPDAPKPAGDVDGIDKIVRMLKEIMDAPNSPIYRAQKELNFKTRIVNMRSEPVLKLEIDSKSIVRALNDLLASPTVRRYADVAARKAAVMYRALRDEITRRHQESIAKT